LAAAARYSVRIVVVLPSFLRDAVFRRGEEEWVFLSGERRAWWCADDANF